MAQPAETETRIKVFVSYSRADKAFASDLVLGLAACGFAPYIDRQDIAAGEDWEKRLAGLITEADTVVYVISPDSLKSENCAQEFRQALALQKRILPVVWRAVDDAAAPPEMKRLNYIFFSGEGRTFAAGLAELADAMRTDIDWIREHTRLSEIARRWSSRNRSAELLLRGDDIDAANAWMAGKPITAPAITDEQSDFIKASSDARAEAERRARRARAGLLTAVSAAAVIFAGLAGFGFWQSQQATQAKEAADIARDKEIAANDGLRSAIMRLGAEVWLRTAPSDNGYYVVDSGWYPVAANYSGAITRVERSGGGHPTWQQTGFIIDGALVHPAYAGEPLLVLYAAAPAGNASPTTWRQPPPDTLPPSAGQNPRIATPDDTLPPEAPVDAKILEIRRQEEEARRARELPPQSTAPPIPDRVARTAPPGVAPRNPEDTLAADDPDQVQRIITEDVETGPETITVRFPVLGEATALTASELVWKTPAQLGGERPFQIWRLSDRPPFGWRAIGQKDVDCQDFGPAPRDRTVAMLGIAMPAEGGPSPKALALNISQLLDRSTPQAIFYTHSTNKASGGAPVFDLSTGGVFAVHVGSGPDPNDKTRRRGEGYSLRHLLDMARSSIKDAQLGPVCGG
jgi:hypothetical protein